jgi:hypothetical protein
MDIGSRITILYRPKTNEKLQDASAGFYSREEIFLVLLVI